MFKYTVTDEQAEYVFKQIHGDAPGMKVERDSMKKTLQVGLNWVIKELYKHGYRIERDSDE